MQRNAAGDSPDVDIARQTAALKLTLSGAQGHYQLFLKPRLPTSIQTHYLLKMAFAVEVTQAGRRISALSSGVTCRERRVGRNRDVIIGFTCRPSGLRKSP
jgi:hypothetical protein